MPLTQTSQRTLIASALAVIVVIAVLFIFYDIGSLMKSKAADASMISNTQVYVLATRARRLEEQLEAAKVESSFLAEELSKLSGSPTSKPAE